MMGRRGFTLIELMISIAILGVLAAEAGFTGGLSREVGYRELQREEVLILLEYHASCASTGRAVDPAVAERLEEGLPEFSLSDEPGAGTTTLTASWTDPLGQPASRSLTVFVGEAGR